MRRRKSSVQRYHDRVAGRYDHSYDDAFWKWHDDLTWDYLRPCLPRNANAEVADLGCGTGKWGLRLLKSGFRVTFVDISPAMLDQARAATIPAAASRDHDTAQPPDKATFLRADLADLSAISENRFALAVAFGEPIGCTASPPETLRGIHRILQPGGVLVATFDNRLAALDYYLAEGDPGKLSRFLRDGRTHWLTKDAAEQFPLVTVSPRELQRWVTDAGFELLSLHGKTVLPMRHHRERLADPAARRTWAAIEKRLATDPDALPRAPHLQIACRKP